MNGAQRRLAIIFAFGFFAVLMAVMIANATSMVADFAAANVPVSPAHAWLFEVSSIIAWVTAIPAICWLVARLMRRRPRWWWTVAALAAGSVIASAWHIALMVAIRTAVYAAEGLTYRFTVGMANPWLYEYRKDAATFLQFCALALLAQWLIARAGDAVPEIVARRTLTVTDGAVTHHVPIDEIEQVSAAGNYVEIGWVARTLLQRGTLAATEEQLGDAFVRIHRGLLVRHDAIRGVATDRSGDFTVTLASGAVARGSRRYRAGIDRAGGV